MISEIFTDNNGQKCVVVKTILSDENKITGVGYVKIRPDDLFFRPDRYHFCIKDEFDDMRCPHEEGQYAYVKMMLDKPSLISKKIKNQHLLMFGKNIRWGMFRNRQAIFHKKLKFRFQNSHRKTKQANYQIKTLF